jgi:hypothetical protein
MAQPKHSKHALCCDIKFLMGILESLKLALVVSLDRGFWPLGFSATPVAIPEIRTARCAPITDASGNSRLI